MESNFIQSSLPGFCPVEAAVANMAAAGSEARGAIYTRREVVEFILDLVGYTLDKPLHLARILEPATGKGDFLLPTIDRLFASYSNLPKSKRKNVVKDLGPCIRAVELHQITYDATRLLAKDCLRQKGVNEEDAEALCRLWLIRGDFLLLSLEAGFTHIVGNPPYVRQELIPDVLMAEYRRRFSTIYDRADIYVPFIERSLSLLSPTGQLGFICANRWMKNRYGGPLRRLIAEKFHLKFCIDMVDTDAFHSEVMAYPAIVVIGREKSNATRVASRPAVDSNILRILAKALSARKLDTESGIREITAGVGGAEPWMLEASDQLLLVRRLEADFPTVEEAGCKVGIGVATGADQVFIAPLDELDVEPDRKLPLVMTRDILTGDVKWRGLGVINPFAENGKLVSLDHYPRLAAYLEKNSAAIKARHVSKKNPNGWYRTIDRIYPELASQPKLLIPDIKGKAHIVYEPGKLYPHHNLYFLTSESWDLHAVQCVLLSNVTKLFISLYSTKMRGGYMRFQAQYLRRIRLPLWEDVPKTLKEELMRAGKNRDQAECDRVTALLYRLTEIEQKMLLELGETANAA